MKSLGKYAFYCLNSFENFLVFFCFIAKLFFRRFVWNFFRLENEHLNNCGKFRAVRDISIAPIESSDQTQILRMMDDENGVLNRGKRKSGGKKQNNTKEEKRALLKEEIVDVDISNAS